MNEQFIEKLNIKATEESEKIEYNQELLKILEEINSENGKRSDIMVVPKNFPGYGIDLGSNFKFVP
jgi:hypothetical protein